jgi:hypothetical protein
MTSHAHDAGFDDIDYQISAVLVLAWSLARQRAPLSGAAAGVSSCAAQATTGGIAVAEPETLVAASDP